MDQSMSAAISLAGNVAGTGHARFRPKSGARIFESRDYSQIDTSPECRMRPANPTTDRLQSVSPEPTFLRMPTVIRMTGLGRTTIYRLMADEQFPHPVKLGPRAVAWRRVDLDRWSEARPMAAQ